MRLDAGSQGKRKGKKSSIGTLGKYLKLTPGFSVPPSITSTRYVPYSLIIIYAHHDFPGRANALHDKVLDD